VSHGQNVTVDFLIGSKCHSGRSELGRNVQAAHIFYSFHLPVSNGSRKSFSCNRKMGSVSNSIIPTMAEFFRLLLKFRKRLTSHLLITSKLIPWQLLTAKFNLFNRFSNKETVGNRFWLVWEWEDIEEQKVEVSRRQGSTLPTSRRKEDWSVFTVGCLKL
jgi:hypothetical protein